ncbi:MAG TPA: TIM barrel protein [Ktedonobacteraceae bacterium]|nr:TIM barrel protein [Ktedonobacteraceae bacterium]
MSVRDNCQLRSFWHGIISLRLSWLWQGKVVRHVHLKDHDGHFGLREGLNYLHPGEGQIDFRRFVQQLKAAGYDGALSLEARAIDSEGQVDVERIQASLQFMRQLIG